MTVERSKRRSLLALTFIAKSTSKNLYNFSCLFCCCLAILVPGWNVTSSNPTATTATLHWTSLSENIYRGARYYTVVIKNMERIILAVETVSGNSTNIDMRGLKPSTSYHVEVYGVDNIGQPYKSLEAFISTKKGMPQLSF